MRASLLLTLAAIGCTRTEDMVIVSGPASFAHAAHRAATACGASTVRVELTGATGRLIAGSDTSSDALRCIDRWVVVHAVKGSGIVVRGGGPI